MTASAPYASVVIPTYERAWTIGTTIESVQKQTVSDIEIIVAADGASLDVLNLVRSIASQDPRVKLLDMPKAPGRGALNRDTAVRSAAGELIFYTDDDDLWLPSHVETLGRALDDADIADTVAVSVSVAGRLHATLGNASDERSRNMLVNSGFKLQYDTHIAHRKAAYLGLGSLWDNNAKDLVHGFFNAFASASHIRWVSLPVPTALSLHGSARAGMTPNERRDEIVSWWSRAAGMSQSDLWSSLTFEPMFLRMLRMFQPDESDTPESYLNKTGVSIEGDRSSGEVPSAIRLPIGPEGRRRIACVMDVFRKRATDRAVLAEVLLPALEPILGRAQLTVFMAQLLSVAMGSSDALAFVRSLRSGLARDEDMRRLLECELLLRLKKITEAAELARRVAAESKFDASPAHQLSARIQYRLGHWDESLAHIEQIDPDLRKSFEIGLMRANALLQLKRFGEASRIARRLSQRRPADAKVKTLLHALADAEDA